VASLLHDNAVSSIPGYDPRKPLPAQARLPGFVSFWPIG